MPSREATLLLRGATIDPADGGAPRDSILIKDDRIAWTGQARDAPRAGRVIDLQGSRLVAGLTDAHLHLYMRAQELLNLELGVAAGSIPALLDRVRAACAAVAAGQWVMSADYSEQFLAERRHPTRAELDAVS